ERVDGVRAGGGVAAGYAFAPRRRERLAERCQRRLDDVLPVRRRFALRPVAAAAAEVRHREVAQQRSVDERIERLRLPGDERALGATDEVDAASQPGAAERAEDAAGDEPAAEREAAAQDVGLQPHERAG